MKTTHSVLKLLIPQKTKTSLRRIQDVVKRSQPFTTKPGIVMTSGKRRRLYDLTTFVWQNRSDVCATLKEMIFFILHCLK